MNPSSQCSDTSGFLFKHKCANPGVQPCSQCGQSICHQHAFLNEDQKQVCATCLKSSGTASYERYDSSPYFYGPCYYSGWGSYHGSRWRDDHYDRDDFTEADGGATEIAGDEGFETEMEGS